MGYPLTFIKDGSIMLCCGNMLDDGDLVDMIHQYVYEKYHMRDILFIEEPWD